MRGIVGGVVVALTLLGCSGGGRTVETAPRPNASGVPSVGSGSGAPIRSSTAATLGIPPGHLPPPGRCRVWRPGMPPGHQERPGDCAVLERRVPAGAWLVYRPGENRKEVRVSVYDASSPRVAAIRFFDIATGRLLREVLPGSP